MGVQIMSSDKISRPYYFLNNKTCLELIFSLLVSQNDLSSLLLSMPQQNPQ